MRLPWDMVVPPDFCLLFVIASVAKQSIFVKEADRHSGAMRSIEPGISNSGFASRPGMTVLYYTPPG